MAQTFKSISREIQDNTQAFSTFGDTWNGENGQGDKDTVTSRVYRWAARPCNDLRLITYCNLGRNSITSVYHNMQVWSYDNTADTKAQEDTSYTLRKAYKRSPLEHRI